MEVNNSLPTGALLKGSSYSYRIEKTLGQGSFGITYLASVKMAGALGAIDANIKVAIKEFFMKDINGRSDTTVTSGSKGGLYDEYKHKFTREALNLSKLQHPNIIKVIESFETNNTVYYVMEYIGGGSLDKYIAEHNGLKEDEAIRIIKQIGSALSFMHKNKMLHLDLKPSNVMMKESGDVVLIDFGLSKQYDEKGEPESSTKVGAGTPGYAPLEQATYREGKGFPVTMDVYALGATMFKMLTGVRAPEAPDILNDGFPLYELQERKVSDALSACIAKAMATTKRDRFQSVNDFIDALENNGEGTIIDVDVVAKRGKAKKLKQEITYRPDPDYIEKEKKQKESPDVSKGNAPIQSVKKSSRAIFLFALLVLLAVIVITTKSFFPFSTNSGEVDTVHTQTDTIKENIMLRDDVNEITPSTTNSRDDNVIIIAPKNEKNENPAKLQSSSKTENNPKKKEKPEPKAPSDAEIFEQAYKAKDWATIEKLGNKGYSKAYYPLALHYYNEGEAVDCRKWSQKAINAGVQTEAAKKLLNEVQ